MTSPDAVFGPGLLWGSHGCPDCKAGSGMHCDRECPRRRRPAAVPAGCRTCLDLGYIEVGGYTCGAPTPWGIPGVGHEPDCGIEPCPEGCQEVRLDQY